MNRSEQLQNFVRLVTHFDWKGILYRFERRWHKLNLAPIEDGSLDVPGGKPYVNSGGPVLEAALHKLTITSEDSILDIGCGKGGAMLTLAKSAFSRVDGVELSPELVQIGNMNLKRAGFDKGRIVQADATAYQGLDAYTFFYMYNPFTDAMVERTLSNIVKSHARRPRKITLVYMNPVSDKIVRAAGFRELTNFPHPVQPISVYVLE